MLFMFLAVSWFWIKSEVLQYETRKPYFNVMKEKDEGDAYCGGEGGRGHHCLGG
jgi:hypothetical protein